MMKLRIVLVVFFAVLASSCIKFNKVKQLTCEQKDNGYLKVAATIVGKEEVYEKMNYNFCETSPDGEVCGDTTFKDILFELKVEGQKNQKVFIPFRVVGRRENASDPSKLNSEIFARMVNLHFVVGAKLDLRLSCLAQIDDPDTFTATLECTTFPIYQDLGAKFIEYIKEGAGFATYDECLLKDKFPLKLAY